MRPALGLAAAAAVFALVATLNAGGYRFGAADQAFYIPAILRDMNPALFPRDAALIDSQSRLFFLDELVARLHTALPIALSDWFLAGYAVTLLLLFAGLVLVGRSLLASPWAVAAFVGAATLRHRIPKTGANTLEGYFHPRQLAFAAGLLAIAAVFKRRPWLAAIGVGAALLVHPTTGVWFGAWTGVALFVSEPALRRPLVALGSAAVLGGLALLAGGFLSLATMDAAWVATLANKDYVFPDDWSAETWALNLLYPALIAGTFAVRRRLGLVTPAETGIVAGSLVLVGLFLVTLPWVAAKVAFLVQLQVSRVFWMADLLAVLYAVWWACEARPAASRSPAPRTRAAVVCAVVAAAALGRGLYVLRVEHPGRALVQRELPDDDWTRVSAWLRRTPPDTHVLADPGHAWRYGTSLRVSAHRDVLLEDVKDGSIAMYDRAVALRVAERRAAIGDFGRLSAARARALAARYDLDLLVSEQRLDLPEVHRDGRFHLYRLTP